MEFCGFPERLSTLASNSPERIAISCAGTDLTFAQFERRVASLAATLAIDFGVAAGERIAWLGLNHPAQIAMLAAVMRLGAILVPLNYRLVPPELRAALEDAEASMLVADATFAEIASGLGVPAVSLDSLWNRADRGGMDARGTDPDRAALIVYTSGTTGTPKGAVHTNRMLHANAEASIAFHRFDAAGDVVLSPLPMFHVGGLCIQTLPAMYAGVRVILMPRFEPGAWLDAVSLERPTISLMVPATMRAVIEHPRWRQTHLASLRMMGAGSSTIPTSLIHPFHSRGVPVCQIYGTTETGPLSIVLDDKDARERIGAAGKPALNVSIRLVDAVGNDAADGDVGEVLVSGPNVVTSYWRDPSNPAFADGWFRTGDLAMRDRHGFYTIVGRAKDMIVSGGENIYPAEIENVLCGLNGVADAAVVGVPDIRWGEVPVAAIVLREGAMLDEPAIRSALAARIARYKHPRRIVFRATLPRNALGKVQKHILVDELLEAGSDGS